MKIKNILILLLITVTLCGCDKKDPSSDDRPKETPNVAPELNMGRMINHIKMEQNFTNILAIMPKRSQQN